MSVEDNKKGQTRIWEEVFNRGNFDVIPELIAPEYTFHNPLGIQAEGPEGFRQMAAMLRTAMPDVHATVKEIFGEGDLVANRVNLTGTFQHEMMGMAPTGRKLDITSIIITQWRDGREIEAWEAVDTLGFMQQLGVPVPA